MPPTEPAIDLFHDWIFSTPPCPDERCALSEHGEWGHAKVHGGFPSTEGIPYMGWNDSGTVWIGVWKW